APMPLSAGPVVPFAPVAPARVWQVIHTTVSNTILPLAGSPPLLPADGLPDWPPPQAVKTRAASKRVRVEKRSTKDSASRNVIVDGGTATGGARCVARPDSLGGDGTRCQTELAVGRGLTTPSCEEEAQRRRSIRPLADGPVWRALAPAATRTVPARPRKPLPRSSAAN